MNNRDFDRLNARNATAGVLALACGGLAGRLRSAGFREKRFHG